MLTYKTAPQSSPIIATAKAGAEGGRGWRAKTRIGRCTPPRYTKFHKFVGKKNNFIPSNNLFVSTGANSWMFSGYTQCKPFFLAVHSNFSCLKTIMKCVTVHNKVATRKFQNRPEKKRTQKAPSKLLLIKWIEKQSIDKHKLLIALGPQQHAMKDKPYEILLSHPASNWTQQLETQQKLWAHGSRTKLAILQQICKEENTYQHCKETSPEKYLQQNMKVLAWHHICL